MRSDTTIEFEISNNARTLQRCGTLCHEWICTQTAHNKALSLFGMIKHDQDPSLSRERCRGLTSNKALPLSCIASAGLCEFMNLHAQQRCLTLTAPWNTLCTHWVQPHRPQSPSTAARSTDCGSRTNSAPTSVPLPGPQH